MRQGVWFFGAALAMTLAGGVAQGMAQGVTQPAPSMVEDHSGLTRERFRRNCLMCHNRAAPEGIAPEIMAGLYPEPGKAPREMMPGLVCWRRCTACRLPDKPSRR